MVHWYCRAVRAYLKKKYVTPHAKRTNRLAKLLQKIIHISFAHKYFQLTHINDSTQHLSMAKKNKTGFISIKSLFFIIFTKLYLIPPPV